ncbi:MAG: DUF2807 domain-containing protein, partial [Pseudomonadota bacterium]
QATTGRDLNDSKIRRTEFSSLHVFFIAGAATIFSSCANAETRKFNETGFDAIDVSAGIVVNLTVGGEYAIEAEGETKALEKLVIRKTGDTLRIGRKNGFVSFGPQDDITVTISAPQIDDLGASSGAMVNAVSLSSDEYSFEASSGAAINASGDQCSALEADASSGAEINTLNLSCAKAVAEASSGARLRLMVTDELSAAASSGAAVVVSGRPEKLQTNTSSGGEVQIKNQR